MCIPIQGRSRITRLIFYMIVMWAFALALILIGLMLLVEEVFT